MKPLKNKTYLKIIENSVDSKIFQSSYFEIESKEKDILEKGKLSCAFFVSAVLKMFDLIQDIHATVDGTLADLIQSGWYEIDKPKSGAILIWERSGINNNHQHIGFYFKNKTAISNSTQKKVIHKHSWNYNGNRKILKILGHDFLD